MDRIDYTEVERLKDVLVGRTITGVEQVGEDYSAEIRYRLDNGKTLVAHATDGGCACSNGCFDVAPADVQDAVGAMILNVEVNERAQSWGDEEEHDIELGSVSDGSATIRVFVYTDLGKTAIVQSQGGDNGYYGWGFWLSVEEG